MSFCPTIIHLLNQSSLACAEPESCIDDTGACTAQDAGSSSGLAKTSLLSIISFDVAPGATYRISLSSYDAISQTQSFQLDVSWSPQGPLLDRRRLRALPQDEPPLWTKKDNKLPDIYRGLVDEDPPPPPEALPDLISDDRVSRRDLRRMQRAANKKTKFIKCDDANCQYGSPFK